jgi:hypothetical protein
LTDGQASIFELIYNPSFRRVGIKTVTQYGKSDVTSLAIIHSLIDRKEKILVVSPSIKQSEIIMGYVIDHLFDHSKIQAMLEVNTSLERLKQERSKSRITLKNGSEFAILTADARTVSQEAKGLMGFGADTVVVDESALIPDEMFGKIFRMVGGTGGKIVQLGNPFPSKHFSNIFEDSHYKTITINWQYAVDEGRFTKEYIEEARRTITAFDFEVFYECRFPKELGEVFRNVKDVATARPEKPQEGHVYVMGVDLARVVDYTVIAIYDRSTNAQVYQDRFQTLDWAFQKKRIGAMAKYYNNCLIVLDATGVGDPIAEDLIRSGFAVRPYRISAQSKSDLIEKMSIYMEQNKIQILPLQESIEEFNSFTYTVTSSGYIKYEARNNMHDDIVIANALAVIELLDPIPYKSEEELTLIQQNLQRLKRGGETYEDW